MIVYIVTLLKCLAQNPVCFSLVSVETLQQFKLLVVSLLGETEFFSVKGKWQKGEADRLRRRGTVMMGGSCCFQGSTHPPPQDSLTLPRVWNSIFTMRGHQLLLQRCHSRAGLQLSPALPCHGPPKPGICTGPPPGQPQPSPFPRQLLGPRGWGLRQPRCSPICLLL